MVDDRETTEKILLYIGGVESVMQTAHCATRLWPVLRDSRGMRETELGDLPLVKGMIESEEQFQIMLGAGIINKIYREFMTLTGEDTRESLEEGTGDSTGNGAQIEAEGGSGIQRISRMLGDIFLPIIPVIVASGILMGVRSFLTGSGLMVTDSNWYNIMATLIDMGFSSLPALIYYSVTKKFGGPSILGFVLGLTMISSTLPAAGVVGKGNAEPMLIQLLRITFKLTGFQGSALVATVGGWFTVEIKNMCRRFVSDMSDITLTSIPTLEISLLVILFGVDPVIHMVEVGVVSALRMLVQLPFGIGRFVTGGLQQIPVILGIHHSLQVTDINFPEEMGTNMYMPIRTAAVVGQVRATTSFLCFTKDKKLKALAGSSSVATWFGIMEPAILGITLSYSVTFVLSCIGSASGSLFPALVHLSATDIGVSAIPSYLLFFNGGAVEYTLVCLISVGISFVLTAVYAKKKGIQRNEHIVYAHS